MIEDMKQLYAQYGFDQEEFDIEKLAFRLTSLLTEEFNETIDAYYRGDSEEIVDGLIDVCVIAIGTLNLLGVDTQKAWDEVMRANFSKVRGVKKGRESSKGFDVVKPAGWVAPSHRNNHGKLDELLQG